MTKLILIAAILASSGCHASVNVLDADLARGYPQTRPVPPQAFVQSSPQPPPKPVSKDLRGAFLLPERQPIAVLEPSTPAH